MPRSPKTKPVTQLSKPVDVASILSAAASLDLSPEPKGLVKIINDFDPEKQSTDAIGSMAEGVALTLAAWPLIVKALIMRAMNGDTQAAAELRKSVLEP